MIDAMQELASAVARLPLKHQARIGPLMVRANLHYTERDQITRLIQETASDLQLQIKYLIFDLEATRRERDFYKSKQGY